MLEGYSKKSLVEKLGIKEGFKIVINNPPENYNDLLGKLPKNVRLDNVPEGPADLIHLFTRSKDELEVKFPSIKKELSEDGILWISWPKGSSKLEIDLSENMVREIGLRNGLVDTKVCATDECWSGLKFVYRLRKRTSGL